ncbi:MAG: hypothetical protein CLLPBCKN_005167 [Chroococcidiopsis cubana SAG 39.79]|uniref:Uncharacterized protein n=2 Tax=Chroococcidiopsis TaxID=54298 RepID=A0AB37UCM7_9CYAN|nr:hypothetical protein [Chroococcidiopsis cubana]MDZ4875747.1 hypothetical protein [Chroococcidiopsis cubana SAG 39.79]PSB63417.1 hypothetical protein C7B79_13960 [Chroococcidiopsis cubana CCALA 043]RUT04946.1 hypothetical protein DSM107010_56320 [Chroococcidiopsis cubana SAG 39.79]
MQDFLQHELHVMLKNLDLTRRCALLVESCGKILQKYDDLSLQKNGRIIEGYSEFIQKQADKLLMYIQLAQLENFCSEDLSQQATQAQAEAKKSYLQALEIYLETMQTRIDALSSHL